MTIFSSLERQDKKHLVTVNKGLKILSVAGVTLIKSKCKYCQTEIAFVGHVVGAEGNKHDMIKIEGISKMPDPKGKKIIKNFPEYGNVPN